MCKAWFAGFDDVRCSLRCVLFPGRQAQDARHLGRYGPGEQFASCARRHSWQWHVHSWFCWLRCSSRCFLRCLRAQDAWHLVDTDQQDSYGDVGKDCVSLSLVWCSSSLPNVFMASSARIALSLSLVWCSCSCPLQFIFKVVYTLSWHRGFSNTTHRPQRTQHHTNTTRHHTTPHNNTQHHTTTQQHSLNNHTHNHHTTQPPHNTTTTHTTTTQHNHHTQNHHTHHRHTTTTHTTTTQHNHHTTQPPHTEPPHRPPPHNHHNHHNHHTPWPFWLKCLRLFPTGIFGCLGRCPGDILIKRSDTAR